MTSLLTILENYWNEIIIVITVYLFVIILIELKDMDFFQHFKLKKHIFKEKENWSRMNYLYETKYTFYKKFSPEDIVLKVHSNFKQLLTSSINNINNNFNPSEGFNDIINKISNQEIKTFLSSPLQWLNPILGSMDQYFLVKNFEKNKIGFKKLLPHLLRLEKLFLTEVDIDSINQGMNFDSHFYTSEFWDGNRKKISLTNVFFIFLFFAISILSAMVNITVFIFFELVMFALAGLYLYQKFGKKTTPNFDS